MSTNDTIEYLCARETWKPIAKVEAKVERELSFGARIMYHVCSTIKPS